jgi:hypothetical protein
MSLDSRWPVTARYALLPAASVLLVTLILLALVRWLAVEEDARRTQLRLQYRATVLANAIDDHLRGSVREMRLLARSPLMSGAVSAPKVRAELDLLLQQSPNYVWIGLIGLDGTVLAGTRGWLEGQSLAARPVFRQSRTGTWLGDVHPAVALAQLMKASGRDMEELIDIGEPVRDADGKVVAVLAAHLGVGWISCARARAASPPAGRCRRSACTWCRVPGHATSFPANWPPKGCLRRWARIAMRSRSMAATTSPQRRCCRSAARCPPCPGACWCCRSAARRWRLPPH